MWNLTSSEMSIVSFISRRHRLLEILTLFLGNITSFVHLLSCFMPIFLFPLRGLNSFTFQAVQISFESLLFSNIENWRKKNANLLVNYVLSGQLNPSQFQNYFALQAAIVTRFGSLYSWPFFVNTFCFVIKIWPINTIGQPEQVHKLRGSLLTTVTSTWIEPLTW